MKAPKPKRRRWEQTFSNVGDNLYRSAASAIYYAIFKRDGKQIRRSLHTANKELARRRLEDMCRQAGRISTQEGRLLPFAEYDTHNVLVGGAAKNWIDIVGSEVEPRTRDRYLEDIRHLGDFFKGVTVRNITVTGIEAWIKTQTPDKCAASCFNKDLEVLKRILEFCVDHGYRLDNPAYRIKQRKGHKKPTVIATRDEYQRLIQQVRQNDAGDSADFFAKLWRVAAPTNPKSWATKSTRNSRCMGAIFISNVGRSRSMRARTANREPCRSSRCSRHFSKISWLDAAGGSI